MAIAEHSLNRLNLLKAIQRFGPVARTDLPKRTGLSSGLITQLTAGLVRRGLVLERKVESGGRGRPRTNLEINSGAAMVIGANVPGGNIITASFVDLAGRRHLESVGRYRPPETLRALADEYARTLAAIIADSPYTASDIGRVGLAIPGEVDSRHGVVHGITTFPPDTVPFADIIADKIGLPVTIENDAVCLARSEHWFGRARDLDGFTLVEIGYAVRSAEYASGVPRLGANGFTAEIGHMKVSAGSETVACVCGARGCLNSFASMYGIAQRLHVMDDVPFWRLDLLLERFATVLDRADAGDAQVVTLLQQAGHHIGLAISNHLNVTDPGNILILASQPRLFRHASRAMERALRDYTLPGVYRNTNIIIEASDEDWRWKGSAALALEQTVLSETPRRASGTRTALRRVSLPEPASAS